MSGRVAWVVPMVGCVVSVDQHVTFDDPVDRVVVSIESGDVEVTGAPGKATLDGTFAGPTGDDGDLVHLRDGILEVTVDCAACGGSVAITVPPGTPLDLTTRAGSIGVAGMRGPVTARVTLGSVEVRDQGTGRVEATAHTGDVTLWRAAAGDTAIDVRQGDARLTVPQGPWDLDLDVTGGSRDVAPGIVDDPAGPLLRAHVRTGSLRVDTRP